MRINPEPEPPPVHAMIRLLDHELWPLAEGALWWPTRKTLIVSDLHLEKGSAFARSGQHLPPYDTRTTLKLLQTLMQRYKPETVISLGDSFHDVNAYTRLSAEDIADIRSLTSQTDWVWVEGNHDPIPPADLGGRGLFELQLGRLTFRHEPTGGRGEVAGHLHPCARLAGRGGKLVRRRCFVTDGNSLVLPAMGAFTGGLNVLDPAYKSLSRKSMQVFMTGQSRVFAVPMTHLIADRNARSLWKL